MLSTFQDLLKELSELLDCPLKIDEYECCVLIIDEKLEVQLELDETQEKLLIACFVAPIPPGKFRENVLMATLKENDKFPKLANFAYNETNNQITIFNYLLLKDLRAQDLSDYIAQFIELITLWNKAIEKGEVVPAEIQSSMTKKPFGLKP